MRILAQTCRGCPGAAGLCASRGRHEARRTRRFTAHVLGGASGHRRPMSPHRSPSAPPHEHDLLAANVEQSPCSAMRRPLTSQDHGDEKSRHCYQRRLSIKAMSGVQRPAGAPGGSAPGGSAPPGMPPIAPCCCACACIWRTTDSGRKSISSTSKTKVELPGIGPLVSAP